MELITVMVLMSILGVAAFGRLGSVSSFDSRAYYNDVIGALQYAQKLAVSTGCQVQVTLDSVNDRYELHQRQSGCTSGAFTRPVMDPAARGNPYQADAPDGVSISPSLTFRFLPDYGVDGPTSNQPINVGGHVFTLIVATGAIDAS